MHSKLAQKTDPPTHIGHFPLTRTAKCFQLTQCAVRCRHYGGCNLNAACADRLWDGGETDTAPCWVAREYTALTRAACWSPGLQSCTNGVITKTQRSPSCYRDTLPSQAWTFYFYRSRSGGRICCLMHLGILEVLLDNTSDCRGQFWYHASI